MDEDAFNLQMRRFLKKVGITSQREIESAVRAALASGLIRGDEKLDARIVLRIPAVDLEVEIDDVISLE